MHWPLRLVQLLRPWREEGDELAGAAGRVGDPRHEQRDVLSRVVDEEDEGSGYAELSEARLGLEPCIHFARRRLLQFHGVETERGARPARLGYPHSRLVQNLAGSQSHQPGLCRALFIAIGLNEPG